MLYYNHGYLNFNIDQALNSTITINTGNSNLRIPPFRPKAIRFTWTVQSNAVSVIYPYGFFGNVAPLSRGIGFATSTTSRACVSSFSDNSVATSDCGSAWSDTSCVMIINGAGAVLGKLDINSITDTGFELIVDDALSEVVPVGNNGYHFIRWEAWGGTDITNVTIGSIAEPAAIGTASYTATGFTTPLNTPSDQCVMIAGVQTVNATDTAQQTDSGLCLGFATSTSSSNQVVILGNSDDASGTSDTDGYNYTGECLAMIIVGGGNPNARAQLSAYGTDTFTLNWLSRGLTNRRYIYMAIKGGFWQAGSTTINQTVLNSTATVTDLPFDILGACIIEAASAQSTAGTSRTEDILSFGSIRLSQQASGVNEPIDDTNLSVYQTYTGCWDQNSQGTMTIGFFLFGDKTSTIYNSVVGGTPSDITTRQIGGNSFELYTNTDVGISNNWIGYLAFGTKNRPVSVGHPFIS
jgi:hypothetical protein